MSEELKSWKALVCKRLMKYPNGIVSIIHSFLTHSGAMRLKNLTVFSLGASSYLDLL